MEMNEKVQERMIKIGGTKKNFMRESQAEEMKNNDKIVIHKAKTDGGILNIDLILEPDKFNQLSSEIRLTLEEYCETINNIVEEEEKEWAELRMKDQINITRDQLIIATILKYAKQEYKVVEEDFTGKDINYIKRYDEEGRFVGEAIILTLTSIPMMGATVK